MEQSKVLTEGRGGGYQILCQERECIQEFIWKHSNLFLPSDTAITATCREQDAGTGFTMSGSHGDTTRAFLNLKY